MSDEKLLSTEEVANTFGLPLNTLIRYRVSGGGPVFTKAGKGINGMVKYAPQDVRNWIESRKVTSTAQAVALDMSPK